MKKLALVIFLLFNAVYFLEAQPFASEETSRLETKGTGEVKVAPDKAVMNISISSKSQSFNEAIQDLNKQVKVLEKEIESAGFKKTDLKTTGYVVNKNIIYTNNGPVDSGYIGRQSFYLEFPNEQTKIINLVKTFSQSKVAADFDFSFTLSDMKQEEVEKELIKKAYKDAEEKAKLIAGVSGVTLKRILTIQYGKPEVIQPRFMANAMLKEQAAASDFSGFTVKELELTDEITVIWEISQ